MIKADEPKPDKPHTEVHKEGGMDPNEKECLFCVEVIKAKAIVCRFCGKELPQSGDASIAESAPDASSRTPVITPLPPLSKDAKPKTTKKEMILGCGCIVIAAFIIMLVLGAHFGGKKEETPTATPVSPTPTTASAK